MLKISRRFRDVHYTHVFVLIAVLVFGFAVIAGNPFAAHAADGSGTNAVLPTSVTAGSTGNTLTFTFTAAETMNSGAFTITIPSEWISPTGTIGVAGYTTGTSGAGKIANVLDSADSAVNWSAGTACTNELSATTTVTHEGAASLACRNGNESTGDKWYKNISAQNWSGYTTVGFWIRTSAGVAANRLQFLYDDTANLASPIGTLNIPAISANTWTYVTVTLTGTRTSIVSYGFQIAHNSALDNVSIFVDDLLVGPGVVTFPSSNVVRTDLLSLAAGQTVVVSYGYGGGASGAAAPSPGRVSTFTTQARSSDSGTLTSIATSTTVRVNNPSPTLTSISPTAKNVGDGTFDMTFVGTNFNASTTAYFASDALVTTYVSTTTVTASVPASKLTMASSVNMVIVNPTPGGGTSTAQVLSISNPSPTLSSIAPNSATAGDPDLVTIFTGTNFVSGSIARLDGANLSTTYNSSTQLTATIASSSLLIGGMYQAAVFNPSPGGGTSTNQVLTVNNVVPTLDSISPSTIEAGTGDTVLTLNGASLPNNYNFATSAVATIDGAPLVTTFVNPRHLTAVVPAAYLVASSTHAIRAFNPAPGGGTSTAVTLFVADTTPPSITITAPTKTSNATITDTTIHVTNTAILAANVVIDPSTTAGTSSFVCVQTNATTVDCTIAITSNGYLVIKATDSSGLSNTKTETGYRIDPTAPVVSITAPTTVSSTAIMDTTIRVTDNNAITAANVIVDPSTTAGTSNYSCTQTNGTTVDCTIRITSSGNLVIKATDDATNVGTQSQGGYVIETTAPVIAITAPTKVHNDATTDTTIRVTDNNAILAASVVVDPSTTAGTSNFSCSQTSSTTVDCTIWIASSGNLVIKATDRASNVATQSEMGYVIEATAPMVVITAPTKSSSATITDTTIRVTDNNAITAANVIVDPSTTAGTSNYSCTQTNGTTVDCTIHITSSGNLVIKATDDATNVGQDGEDHYLIDTSVPVVAITAPRTASSTAITNTTVRVTDGAAITAANVTVDPTTTAGTAGFSCTQTDTTTVDCSISITSSGNLVIRAVDDASNVATGTRSGYVIEATAPVITITAPTKTSNVDITNTTIRVTDNNAILAANVVVDGSTTALTHDYACVQTDSKTVDCTLEVSGSGTLVMRATDDALNSATQSETGYVIDVTLPTIAITAPTKTSSTTITNTTIRVTDNNAILAANVVVDGSTTAGTSNFSCSQTSSTTVDCTIHITSSGNLTIKATDSATNVRTDTVSNYIIDATAPVVTITAPTKTSITDITDTTVRVTDNRSIPAANVVVDPATTSVVHNVNCTQTNATTVDCTLEVDASGDLVIKATDSALNVATKTESGYVITRTGPTIATTSPTKTSSTAITNTTIRVTDSVAVSSTAVIIAPSTTAGTAGFSCVQTNGQTVDCTLSITSSGNLVIVATNSGAVSTTDTVSGYVIEAVAPVITFTAPTKVANADITNTTIRVTDNNAIVAASVVVDPSTTAFTHDFSCVQTNATTVDCTIEVDDSGDVTIKATDVARNVRTTTETGYVLDVTNPAIAITATTKTSSTAITNTTIRVTDNNAILATNVVVDPATTAGMGGWNCVQTNGTTVDCTLSITSSGILVVKATDAATNVRTETETGYVIETTPPVITITAPTKVSGASITDTTIRVTDNNAILAANVTVDAVSTADTSNFICTQTNSTTVDCTIRVDVSGSLVISATDNAQNTASQTESGYVIMSAPPVISSVSATPSNTAATITWSTDALSSSKVIYGPDTTYSATTVETDTAPRVISHTVSLSGLVACTEYHYKVVSRDAALQSSTSTDGMFTTTGCAGSVSPLSQTDQTIATSGGTLSITYGGQTFSTTLPSGYAGAAANIQIKTLTGSTVLASIGSPSSVQRVGSYVWDLRAMVDASTVLSSVTGGATITMSYTAAGISSIDEHSLQIYRYSGGSWAALPGCSVNMSARTVTCTTTTFSIFGLFGASGASADTGSGGVAASSMAPYTTAFQSHTSDSTRSTNLQNLDRIGVSVHALVKLPNDGNAATQDDSAVYYIGADGKRHAFPNQHVFATWYPDFSGVTVLTAEKLASIPLGLNVHYKPGVRMVKFTTDPKVYAVTIGGILQWISTESLATQLYGAEWNTRIDDVNDAFYSNYVIGKSLTVSTDMDPLAQVSGATSISTDLGI